MIFFDNFVPRVSLPLTPWSEIERDPGLPGLITCGLKSGTQQIKD